MHRCRSASLALAVLALANGCGGDDGPGASGAASDAGADADGSVAAGGSGGDGGSGAGGADASTSGPDAGPVEDSVAPDFNGASSVEVLSDRQVRVGWDAALDDHTPQAAIAYRVYRAAGAGAQDFGRAQRCDVAGSSLDACYRAAPAGATSLVFTDISPDTDFYFVARAVDGSGNEDDNLAEVSARTDDATSPSFGGVLRVDATSPTSITVGWNEGYDKPTPAAELHYDLYVGVDERPDPAVDTPYLSTSAGELSAELIDLAPQTTYWVLVRAVDPTGNLDANVRYLSARTPEGVPPAFQGAKRALADETTITLLWTPATDNSTEQANIVYDIWESVGVSRGQNLSGPPQYTSLPGRASFVIPDREPGTQHYYIVRARDVAGNSDSNIKQVSIRTGGLPDTQAPSFNGIDTVTGTSPDTLHITWGPAADNNSPGDAITGDGVILFDVYVSNSTQMDFSTPTITTTAEEAFITGLPPSTQRFVVVRARDEAGNRETNTKQASGSTLANPNGADTAAPAWAAGPTATLVPGRRGGEMDVAWTTATDDTYGAADLRYLVCAEEVEARCLGTQFFTHVRSVSAWGATTARLAGLAPRTDYFVVVRAEDRSGNQEPSGHSVQASTSTSWWLNVRPLILQRCVACHSGGDDPDQGGTDLVAFDNLGAISDVGGSLLDDNACDFRRDTDAGIPIDQDDGCVVKLVDPGHPEHSLIYRKINPIDLAIPPFSPAYPNRYAGSREPRDTGESLTADEDSIFRDWIEQGALGD